MYNKKIYLSHFFILFLSFSVVPSMSQLKKTLTLDDLVVGGNNYKEYRPQMPQKLQFWGNKLLYSYGDSIIQLNEKKQFILKKEELQSSLNMGDININSIKFPYSEPIIQVQNKDYFQIYDFQSNKSLVKYLLPQGSSRFDFSKISKNLACTKENNLFIINKNGEKQISFELNKNIVFGQAAHRNEFGISKGTFWSPSGNFLAFYKMDQSMVTDYPLVDINARVAKLKNIKYPMAGMPSHEVSIGIYNTETNKTLYLNTGSPKDRFFTNITWSPDDKLIYIAEVNRNQDTCRLNAYNANTGELAFTLFQETNNKYIEPQVPILFLPNNPQEFLWQSRRDGYNHLYLYNTSGKLIRQITSGSWDITSMLGFDLNGNPLIISNEYSPLNKQIVSVNINSGKRTMLSKELGVHRGILNASKNMLCDIYSSQNNPGKIDLIDLKKLKTSSLYEADNPLDGCTIPTIKIDSLLANDAKTQLYYRITLPSNFDPSKKYPVVVYLYGGPHSQLVQNSWMGDIRGWDIYMAERGFILFTLDNRGTDNRGFEFSSITHRHLGIIETEDQMTGINYLRSLPYVDKNRIGVHGWSYGGFMTLNLVLRYPYEFKAAVAGGPVVDWKDYEIMYGERYMDTPEENPKGYEETNMENLAGSLKSKLLIIHGYDDNTVVLQHSLKFLKACIANSTQPDFFLYPEGEHNMRGSKRVHLYKKITRYFEEYLK